MAGFHDGGSGRYHDDPHGVGRGALAHQLIGGQHEIESALAHHLAPRARHEQEGDEQHGQGEREQRAGPPEATERIERGVVVTPLGDDGDDAERAGDDDRVGQEVDERARHTEARVDLPGAVARGLDRLAPWLLPVLTAVMAIPLLLL